MTKLMSLAVFRGEQVAHLFVYLVHGCKIVHVLQVYVHFHDLLPRRARCRQDISQVFNALGLRIQGIYANVRCCPRLIRQEIEDAQYALGCLLRRSFHPDLSALDHSGRLVQVPWLHELDATLELVLLGDIYQQRKNAQRMRLKLALSGEFIFSTDILNSFKERLSIKRTRGHLCLQLGADDLRLTDRLIQNRPSQSKAQSVFIGVETSPMGT